MQSNIQNCFPALAWVIVEWFSLYYVKDLWIPHLSLYLLLGTPCGGNGWNDLTDTHFTHVNTVYTPLLIHTLEWRCIWGQASWESKDWPLPWASNILTRFSLFKPSFFTLEANLGLKPGSSEIIVLLTWQFSEDFKGTTRQVNNNK